MIKHRNIDLIKNKEILLNFHCQINYECESDFARETGYELYKEKWLKAESQIEEYISALSKSMDDVRTIAEIREIAVARQHRIAGIGGYIIQYIERNAKMRGASILRSGTGYRNISSRRLHESCGFKPYRIEYEKIL